MQAKRILSLLLALALAAAPTAVRADRTPGRNLGGREPLTQRETAARCGISRSYISRIEKRALEKLRAAME